MINLSGFGVAILNLSMPSLHGCTWTGSKKIIAQMLGADWLMGGGCID